MITFLIRRDRHWSAQRTVRRKGAFHVHRYQTSKQPFPTLKRIRQNCSSNCARDFGAGRFPVEGSLGAVRNHVDSNTPIECGEKYGEFLPGKSRIIVRAFRDEKIESHDSQTAMGAAKKKLLDVRKELLLHQRVQVGQLSGESSQQSRNDSRIFTYITKRSQLPLSLLPED